MSHIVQIQTEVRNAEAMHAACRRLQLPAPVAGTVQLFNGQVTGLAVQLPDWRYPAICHLEGGRMEFDNFGGRWKE